MENPPQLNGEFNTALRQGKSASDPGAECMENPPLQMENNVSGGVFSSVCVKFSPYHDVIFHSKNGNGYDKIRP